MSDTEQQTEQQPEPKKVKDPKRVAAGKRLAEYNKRERERIANLECQPAPSPEKVEIVVKDYTTTYIVAGISIAVVGFLLFKRRTVPTTPPTRPPVREEKKRNPQTRPKKVCPDQTSYCLVKNICRSQIS